MNSILRPRVADTRTGEIFIIDPQAARISRLWRRARAWADALGPSLMAYNHRLVMVTLTYKPTPDGKTAWRPGHIRDYLKRLKYNLKNGLLAYVWVAELQQRGEVHYHVLLLVRRGTDIPRPDESWWPHGSSKIETARSRYYILKYCQKSGFRNTDGEWKAAPRGMRLFAVWLSDEVAKGWSRFAFKLSAVPRWLEEIMQERAVIVHIRRAKGGGWNITGDAGDEHIPSPYRVVTLYEQIDDAGNPTGATY